MASAEQVPEHADGGFWYVVAVREAAGGDGGMEPDLPAAASGWCAWYGAGRCVVRSPDPLVGAGLSPVPPAAVLNAAVQGGSLPALVKPRGRVGGR